MRSTSSVAPEDSLDRTAAELRRSGNGLVPVTSDNVLVGVVTEFNMAVALAESRETSDSAASVMSEAATIQPYATAAEALRFFADGKVESLLVTDDMGRLMGILTPSDLYPRKRMLPRPALVGGMATPFGVYLTNGAIAAGAGGFALVLTGTLLFLLLATSQLLVYPLSLWLTEQHQPDWLVLAIDGTLPVALFLLAMRLIPLSGTHGAEHQVVHALERGEELKPEIVRRMPRVHPRCGTNLAVGAMLFLGIFGTPWIPSIELRFMVAAMTTMLLWKRIGSFFQQNITTKPASERQIRSGIKAAEDLLDQYSRTRIASPSIPLRLWRSGMLHVMSGSFVGYGLVWLIAQGLDAWCNVKLPI